MRLTEAWLVAIEGDHDGALQRTMTEATITTLHQRIMDSRIEDGSIDFTSFLDIHEAIVLGTLVRLLQGALHLGAQKLIDTLLKFGPEVEAIFLQSWCAFKPALYQLKQRWFILRTAYGMQSLLIVAKDIRVFLIVLDTLLRQYAQLILDQSKLKGLKARCWRQILAEVHEIQRRHSLQNGHLIYQQLWGRGVNKRSRK